MRNPVLSQLSIRLLAVPLIAALLASACASQSPRPESSGTGEAAPAPVNREVERRALERWNLLVERKAEKAYDYLSPGYRKTLPREQYAREMNNRPVRWSKVLPYRQDCSKPDVCVLDLQVDYETKVPGVRQNVASVGFVNETWIRVRGKWYLLPKAKDPTGGK
jgi:hypothetical protein